MLYNIYRCAPWGGLSGCTFDKAVSWGKVSRAANCGACAGEPRINCSQIEYIYYLYIS